MSIVTADSNEKLFSYFTDIHIGVVTALQVELDALIGFATHHETIVGPKRTYHKLVFTFNGKEFTVIAHTLGRMGIATMSITLMEILYNFPQLKYVALIGIAAGSDSGSQNFGDVLIPEKVYNYESGKYVEEDDNVTFKSDYNSFDIDTAILQKISAVSSNKEIIATIQSNWRAKKDYKLKVHTGNFACGSAVIASRKKIEEIEKAVSRKYIGIDMETYALAIVNRLKHNEYPKMFIIKSISDFADSDKNDSEHEFASFVAAAFFLETCSLVLIDNEIKSELKEGPDDKKKSILIISATYEWLEGQVDVTPQIKEFINKNITTIIVDPSTFGIQDPAWGSEKTLFIHCKINGEEKSFKKKDGERFRIE
jgi:nucleoside phosphorylase